jgi:uncharacterized protein YsxB (DUF464 family)
VRLSRDTLRIAGHATGDRYAVRVCASVSTLVAMLIRSGYAVSSVSRRHPAPSIAVFRRDGSSQLVESVQAQLIELALLYPQHVQVRIHV